MSTLAAQDGEQHEHELKGGRLINVTQQLRTQLGEALVDPEAMSKHGPSLAEAIFTAITCHPDPGVRKVRHLQLRFIHAPFVMLGCLPAR